MSYYDPSPPDTSVQLPHKLAAKEQRARDQMRKLLKELPEDEAATHTALLNTSEAAIEAKKAGQLNQTISWDSLSGEMKNLIYKTLMVQEKPIQPHIERPHKEDREVRKFDLGANLLRCNSTIRGEAEPLLLGENVFELNQFMVSYLGGKSRSASRRRRQRLVRKLICYSRISGRARITLEHLPNVEDLTIIVKSRNFGYVVPESQWERQSVSYAIYVLCPFLKEMIESKSDINYHIVHEHFVGDPQVTSNPDRNGDMVAYRWEVVHDASLNFPHLKFTLLHRHRYADSVERAYPMV